MKVDLTNNSITEITDLKFPELKTFAISYNKLVRISNFSVPIATSLLLNNN